MAALFLAALTLALYSPALRHEFVNFDDDHYITRNPNLRAGLSPQGVRWAFTTFHGANWFPLTWLSWQLDVSLWGLDPAGFHLGNLLLHAAASAALLLALVRMTGSLAPAAFVAAVFALHPAHVESVAWAAARKDVLSGLFCMLALLAHARPGRRGALTALLAACALLSKPTAVVLPLLLLLLDAWPLRRIVDRPTLRAAVLEKLPLLGLALAAGVLTVLAQRAGEAVQTLEAISLRARVLNALASLAWYLRASAWPTGLAVYYPHPAEAVSWLAAAGGAVLLAALSFGAFRLRQAHPWLGVGWLWFLLALAPVIGVVQVGQQARADRYLYLPLVGLAIAVAFEGAALFERRPALQRPLAWAGLMAVFACAATASRQLGYWRDSLALFERALAVTEQNAVAELNLGVALLERGRAAEASGRLAEAVRIQPGSAEGQAGLGEALARQGRSEEAERHLRTALRLDARLPRAHNGLGRLLLERGDEAEAVVHFREAISLEASYAEPYANLGGALVAEGAYLEAIEYSKQAVALDPGLAEAHGNWGVALLARGELDAAAERFREAARLKPALGSAHQNLGLALSRRQDFEGAAAAYAEALRLQPDDATSLMGLGLALAHLGRLAEARTAFERAAALRPKDPELLTSWGMALAGLGQPQAALERYRAALAIAPRYAEAHGALGRTLAGMGRVDEALPAFQAAATLKPGVAQSWNDWALALAARGRLAEAVDKAREALRTDPGYADARNNLGVFLARMGRVDEARAEFQETLRRDPTRADARQNLERLGAARP